MSEGNAVVRREPEQGVAVYVCGCCEEVVTRRELCWWSRDLETQVCHGCAQGLLMASIVEGTNLRMRLPGFDAQKGGADE